MIAFLLAFVTVPAVIGAPRPARQAQPTDPRSAAREISEIVSECIDGDKPIDMARLLVLGDKVQSGCKGLDEADRARLIESLGMFLLHETRKIKFKEGAYVWGMDPRPRFKGKILAIFAELNDKKALPYLEKYYRLHGHETKVGIREIAKLIRAFGKKPPEPIEVEKRRKAEEAKRKANRAETAKLLKRLENEKLHPADLSKIFLRLGEVGDERAVGPIIKKLAPGKLHWIAKQNALRALGRLGGPEARGVLVKELTRPMPGKPKLDDYGEVEAILRSYAARGLGRCGDASVLPVLENLGADPKQYKRARESCRWAAGKIKRRLAKQATTTRPATTTPSTRPSTSRPH